MWEEGYGGFVQAGLDLSADAGEIGTREEADTHVERGRGRHRRGPISAADHPKVEVDGMRELGQIILQAEGQRWEATGRSA